MSDQPTNGPIRITPQMIERAMEALNGIWGPNVAEGWVTSRDVVQCVLQAALDPSRLNLALVREDPAERERRRLQFFRPAA